MSDNSDSTLSYSTYKSVLRRNNSLYISFLSKEIENLGLEEGDILEISFRRVKNNPLKNLEKENE